MNKIGFIGFGSMGSMLIKGFIESGQVRRKQIFVTRKDKSRLDEIKKTWPGINISQDAVEVVKNAEYIFICAKPLEYKNILSEIKPFVRPHHHIVSITGAVTIENMEKMVDCRITKIMPTIVSEVKEGISLVCHNSKVAEEDADRIESLLGNISRVWRIDEKDFGFASEFTSCGPGLIAAIFQELVEAGLRHSGSFKKEEITEMVLKTLYGTSMLMLEKKMDFRDVISRVATKGGITEEGVKVIEKSLPRVFDEMLGQCMNKRKTVSDKISDGFRDICNNDCGNNITIREITRSDIPECVNIIRASFQTVADEFGFTSENAPRFTAFATTEERLNWQLDNEPRKMFVCCMNGTIIGYYSLLLQQNNECELNNLCVLPAYRHKGIGERLLKNAFEVAKGLNCVKMNIGIVEENTRLRKWYESFGFKHTGTKKFDFFPFTCGYLSINLSER